MLGWSSSICTPPPTPALSAGTTVGLLSVSPYNRTFPQFQVGLRARPVTSAQPWPLVCLERPLTKPCSIHPGSAICFSRTEKTGKGTWPTTEHHPSAQAPQAGKSPPGPAGGHLSWLPGDCHFSQSLTLHPFRPDESAHCAMPWFCPSRGALDSSPAQRSTPLSPGLQLLPEHGPCGRHGRLTQMRSDARQLRERGGRDWCHSCPDTVVGVGTLSPPGGVLGGLTEPLGNGINAFSVLAQAGTWLQQTRLEKNENSRGTCEFLSSLDLDTGF